MADEDPLSRAASGPGVQGRGASLQQRGADLSVALDAVIGELPAAVGEP